MNARARMAAWEATLRAHWNALAQRERIAVGAAAAAVLLLLVWSVAIVPAWRVARSAPATLDRLDAQLQQMRRLAVEASELKAAAPVGAAESAAALRSATERLGAAAQLSVLGDRATLTLKGVDSEALRQWLAEARSGARARPLQAQLSRGARGYSGTLVVALAGAS